MIYDFKAAVFDLDGTLINSNSMWEKLDRIVLEKRNIYADDEFIKSLAAMTYEEAERAMSKIGLDITTEELRCELDKMARIEYAENINMKKGAAECLAEMKRRKIKISLATASPYYFYEPVLKRCGVYGLFDAFSTTDEAGKDKSSPEVYLLAAKKINEEPRNCMVFEDVKNALQTAEKAGFMTTAVYDEYSQQDWKAMCGIADRFIYDFD